jgi:hypothetical protein
MIARIDPHNMGFCEQQVRIDLEREMGITEALMGQPNKSLLKAIEKARVALGPEIVAQAKILYRWFHS